MSEVAHMDIDLAVQRYMGDASPSRLPHRELTCVRLVQSSLDE